MTENIYGPLYQTLSILLNLVNEFEIPQYNLECAYSLDSIKKEYRYCLAKENIPKLLENLEDSFSRYTILVNAAR